MASKPTSRGGREPRETRPPEDDARKDEATEEVAAKPRRRKRATARASDESPAEDAPQRDEADASAPQKPARKRSPRKRTSAASAPLDEEEEFAEPAEAAPRPYVPGADAIPIDEETLEEIRREVEADHASEDELLEMAASLQDDDEDPEEDDGLIPTGPVFVGEVPLDTPEQRLEAMQKAAARLRISDLHPEQIEVIDAVLRGEDVLMVLPTGFGKSACYQIPSIIMSKPVLVISPLLALMKDQYEKMERLGLPCIKLDGTLRGGARKRALAEIAEGNRVLVMTTPETLASPDAAAALAEGGISMAAVDEAHCISEWGYDFRPAYLQIGERLRLLGGPPALALTATATEKVRLAITRFVGLRDHRVVAASPHRDNLAFDVLHCSSGARLRALVRLALRVRRPGIIYCSTTRDVDEIYAVLQRFGVPSYRYHGKMTASERIKSQEGFMQRGRRTVMIATNAFGLGIDKIDIRYVMHYQSPSSLEQYVQEAGRGGRDGRRANCIMLFSPDDRAIHEALLSRSRVRPEQLYRLTAALAAWAKEEKIPSVQALALSAELGSRTTSALLALLEEGTLVKWDPEAVYVTVPAEEFETRARKLAGQFETLRTQDARRLDAVTDYALEESCRAVFLQDYFGEEGAAPCGMCDHCRGGTDRPNSFWEPLAPPKGDERRRSRRPSGSGNNRSGRNNKNQRGRGQPQKRRRRGRGNSDGRKAPAEADERTRTARGPAADERPNPTRAKNANSATGANGGNSANGANASNGDARRSNNRRRGRRRGGRSRRRKPNPESGGPRGGGDPPGTTPPS